MLRIPGDGTETFIDREREHRNHVAAAAAGVTPPVLHLIQPGYCTIVPFIAGETMHPETIAGHPERLRLIVEAVRTYHDRAVFDNEIRVFDMIRDYTRMAAEVGAPRPVADRVDALGRAAHRAGHAARRAGAGRLPQRPALRELHPHARRQACG